MASFRYLFFYNRASNLNIILFIIGFYFNHAVRNILTMCISFDVHRSFGVRISIKRNVFFNVFFLGKKAMKFLLIYITQKTATML